MNKTNQIVLAAMFCALCCIATMIIKIPSPFKGYINLGDCVVLLSGFMLCPLYAFLASGIGSALCDIFSGYIIYAPVTFIIKGLMALVVCYGYKYLKKHINNIVSMIVCCIVAETIMVLGYFVFEGFLYGFIPSAVNIPLNSIQGFAGLVIGVVLAGIFNKKYNFD